MLKVNERTSTDAFAKTISDIDVRVSKLCGNFANASCMKSADIRKKLNELSVDIEAINNDIYFISKTVDDLSETDQLPHAEMLKDIKSRFNPIMLYYQEY